LRQAVALVAVRELGRRIAATTVGRAGPDALRAMGHAVRTFAREHPGLYAATQIAPGAEGEQGAALALAAGDVVDVIGAVLRGFGLPDDRSIDAVRVVRSAVHGFAVLESGGGFGLPDDLDRSF